MKFNTETDRQNAARILAMYGESTGFEKSEGSVKGIPEKYVIGKLRSGKEITNEAEGELSKSEHKQAYELCKSMDEHEAYEYHKEKYNDLIKSEAYETLKDSFDLLIKSEEKTELETENKETTI